MSAARFLYLTIVLGGLAVPLSAAETVESVTSRKDRCESRLDRIDQQLDNIQQTIDRLDKIPSAAAGGDHEAALENARNKEDFFHSRSSRARGQVDRINDRLAGVQGVCPDCILSEVELFCRQVEALQSDVTEYTQKLRDQERALRARCDVSELIRRTDTLLARAAAEVAVTGADSGGVLAEARLRQQEAVAALSRRQTERAADLTLSAAQALSRPTPDLGTRLATAEKAAGDARARLGVVGGKAPVILDKATEHLAAGRAHLAAGRSAEALTELQIAETLIRKACTIAPE